jgi:hypothetical protein
LHNYPIAVIKLNRDPVAQDHKNLAWASKNFQTVTHLATEILNISTAKSVAELEEFMLGY